MKGYIDIIKSGYVEFGSDDYWRCSSIIERSVDKVEKLTNVFLKSQKIEDIKCKLCTSNVSIDL